MGFLDGFFPNDHKIAATKYAGRESASTSAQRAEQQRADRKAAAQRAKTTKDRSRGAAKAAVAGQAWEDNDRAKFHRTPRLRW